MFDNYPDVVRPKQLQEMLHIGRTKSYQLIKNGTLPCRRIGGDYFIRKIDVIQFLQEQE